MKHYTYDEWLQYVNDEINKTAKEELEKHLYTCDQCLNHYLKAVEANETSLPILSNQSSFTDAVMAGISTQKTLVPSVVPDTIEDLNTMPIVPSVPDTVDNLNTISMETLVPDTKISRKKPYYQQAAFHYLLAAAATLLLTFSGVFQSLAAYASSIEKPQIQEKKPSMTEDVINKTFAWMDSLDKKGANKK
ncbi:anti-sigma factor family protein [Neobacillus drentensis]|uniref:anti-sigma factor family protein n=1 Tax=Neobacillus drentensis TaxID=220684 RepID=UPI002FFE0DC9